jgi:hypothetical protein
MRETECYTSVVWLIFRVSEALCSGACQDGHAEPRSASWAASSADISSQKPLVQRACASITLIDPLSLVGE